MKTELQILSAVILIAVIAIWKMGRSIGYAKARREMQDAIEKSGVISADGCTFYRVQKISWHEPKSRAHHSPTDHSPKITTKNQAFRHYPTEE